MQEKDSSSPGAVSSAGEPCFTAAHRSARSFIHPWMKPSRLEAPRGAGLAVSFPMEIGDRKWCRHLTRALPASGCRLGVQVIRPGGFHRPVATLVASASTQLSRNDHSSWLAEKWQGLLEHVGSLSCIMLSLRQTGVKWHQLEGFPPAYVPICHLGLIEQKTSAYGKADFLQVTLK